MIWVLPQIWIEFFSLGLEVEESSTQRKYKGPIVYDL